MPARLTRFVIRVQTPDPTIGAVRRGFRAAMTDATDPPETDPPETGGAADGTRDGDDTVAGDGGAANDGGVAGDGGAAEDGSVAGDGGAAEDGSVAGDGGAAEDGSVAGEEAGTTGSTDTTDTAGVGLAERPALETAAAADLAERIVGNVERVIVGKHDAIEHVLVTVLARGHLLVEDVPGVGKTTLAKAFARSIDASFKRVQFTPDLLPSDVTGVNVFNQRTDEFDFQPGPVFANVVLGDEINRAPPKTQSALLEAMEEQQVTTDGVTRTLPDPFCVIATQNDVEPGRTYELPVAEVDRFTKKVRLGYPDVEEEAAILGRTAGEHPIESVEPVATVEEVRRARATVANVEMTEPVRTYVARLAEHTRRNATLGVSPRGSLALVRTAQVRAVLEGRDYVIPDDVQAEAPTVLAHRVRTDSGATTGREVVEDALDRVPVG